MAQGKPAQGFRMSKHLKTLIAQGHSIEDALKMRDGMRQVNQTVSLVGRDTTMAAIEPATKIIETEEQILARLQSRFTIMRKMVKAATAQDINSVIISGPPGLGKSFETYDELRKSGKDYKIVRGRLSAVGLFVALYYSKSSGSVLVMDDVDVFGDEKTLDILKAATDTTGSHEISWGTQYEITGDDGEILPRSFTFEGSVVFITNNDFRGMVNSGSKISKHLEALMSRSHYIDLGMKNKMDFMVRIRDVVVNHKMLNMVDSDRDDILDFIEEHKERFDELSLRMVAKLAGLRSFDADWKNTAKVTLMKNIA